MKIFLKKTLTVIVIFVLSINGCICSLEGLKSLLGYENSFSMVKTKLSSACDKYDPYKLVFNYFYGLTMRLIGKTEFQYEEVTVYKLKNNYLARKLSVCDASQYIDNIKSFNDFLKEEEIINYYVITAESGDERLNQLPNGVITNNVEETTNNMRRVLDSLNIDYIDTFDYLKDADGGYYYYFYKTDHHWNDYAGLFVAELIAKNLNDKFDFNINEDMFKLSNYDSKVYKEMSLGSLGKKVTHGFIPIEDFEMLIPRFENNYRVTIGDANPIIKQGSYTKALINNNCLNYNYYFTHCYSSYLFGNKNLIQIENLLNNNGKRVLVIKDSKANVVNCHLANAVQYLDIIDPRYKSDIREYIKESRPDIVISMFSPFADGCFYDIK